MNGGSGGGSTPVVSVASLNNQTILYNFSSSQEATITGLTLTNNNWGINVVEEWNSGSGDIYFNSCSLLCHFDSINSDGRFIDNSSNNFAITSSGGAGLSTSQYKFGGASAYFDGNLDYLNAGVNSAYSFGSGDFTIESWVYIIARGSSGTCFAGTWAASGRGWIWISTPTQHGFVYSTNGTNETSILSTYTIPLNIWTHLATVRNGNTVTNYANGVSIGNGSVTGVTISTPTQPLYIGANKQDADSSGNAYQMNGYIDEFRITKGVARYTANFTPPNAPFPNSATQTATKYIGLVGGLNDTNVDYGIEKISDGSLKIKKLTDTQQPSGSFLSSSVDRVYVNVLNYSNVSVGSPLLGQTFTAVGSTSSYALSRSVINPYEIIVAVDGAVQSFNNAYSVTSSTINFTESIPSGSLVDIRFLTTPNVNSASYALTSSYSLNAASGGGSVSTGSIVNQTILYNFSSSQESTLTGLNLTGNKWGVTVVEEWNSGSIVGDEYYNSCSLLMHFSGSNGSTTTFIDNSPNNLTTTSNNGASISTVQSKFGGSSLLLDGTNDYLSIASNSVFDLTGDYTIEFWAYSSTIGNGGLLHRGFYNNTNWSGLSFSIRGIGGSIRFYFYATTNANEQYIDATTPSNNAWHHFAMVKSGTTGRVFIDGTLSGTINGLNTPAASSQTLRIGVWDYFSVSPGAEYFNGYIDEIRITKGYARYTGSFTVPASAFPDNIGVTQLQTKYIGLVGGLNDSTVDYGVEKLSDSSLKIRKMTASGQPLSGSGTLSASVDRVYVNVLNYENAVITGSISNSVTASYSLTSSNIFGGTRNYVPLWSGTTTLSSSIIYQSGSNIGIGTINPPALLSVSNSLDDVRINNGSGLSSIRIYGYNQAGGAGFTGFLELQNTFASATNSKKFFRLNSTGTIEIINNAYTTAIFSLTDAGVLSTPGGGTSDVRKKQNIEYIIDDATPIINQFKPVVFEFIEHGGVKRHGFIAQDVLTFKPDLVLGDGDKTDGTYGLDYDGILSLTVKSLQEANKKINDLESAVNILIEEVNNLKTKIGEN
jgi:hypothetical protein